MKLVHSVVLLTLLTIGARAAGPFDCIPEQAVLAVQMRTARFFAAEPLRALTESGDVSRIREELALIPWDGGLPDAVLLYFGATQSYAVLVECRTEPEELKRKILRKYEKNPNVSLRQLTERGFPVLRLSFTRPDKPGRIKNYDLVRLADDVVLMAGNRNPTPWEALDRRYSSAMGRQLRQAPEALLLFGVCDDPGKLGIDPLGMTRTILDNGVKAARALSGGNITSLFEVEDGRRTCDDCWSVLPPFRGCAMVKSTSRDMAAYYRMIANMGMHEGKQAIPAHAVDLLVGRYHPLSHLMTMCMGLNKREFAGHVVCEHAGGLHGVSSKGALLLGEGYGFAVLCNQGDEDMDALLYGMLCAVMGLPLATNMDWFTPAGRDFSAPHMIRGRYIGHEGVPSILCIHCEEDGSHLRGTRDGEDLRLVYCGGARFLAVKPDAPDTVVCHLEFLIRAGRAWGVRVGTRVFERD